jgi:DNA-binding transcriptional ArsR family regulator
MKGRAETQMQERGRQDDRRREKALARAPRVAILAILARGAAGLRQIAAATEEDLAVIAYHLRVLVACRQIEPDPETGDGSADGGPGERRYRLCR